MGFSGFSGFSGFWVMGASWGLGADELYGRRYMYVKYLSCLDWIPGG